VYNQRVQDKVAVLDGQVQELKDEKERLIEENRALQKSKTILEKVYALKEEQVQVLQGANGVRLPHANPCTLQHGCRLACTTRSVVHRLL
jgi:regulator of replication initiation timing